MGCSTTKIQRQVLAALVMSMSSAIFGVLISFGGLLLAESQSEEARLSLSDATLIVSAAQLGRMIGCLLSAQLAHRLGVLRPIQMSLPLNVASWLLVAFGGKRLILAGAIGAGLVVGLTDFACRLYIAEITSHRSRGVLCQLPGLSVCFGLLFNFSFSSLMPWRISSLVCGCAPSIVQLIGTLLLPNSPRWLINHNAPESQVKKAIKTFRNEDKAVNAEIKEIQDSLKGRPTLNIFQQVRLIFSDWTVGKPCLLVAVQFFFETFCGGIVVTQNALSVFQQAVRTLTPGQCTPILAAMQMAALVGCTCLLTRFGRRTVLMGAGVFTCFSLLAAASFFYFPDTLGDHTWLVLVGIVLADATSQGMIGPMSHLYCGELLPLPVRQMFGNVISLEMGALGTIFINLFPLLREAIGLSGLFTVIASVNLLQVLYAKFVLPETRGLSLEEVQKRISVRRPVQIDGKVLDNMIEISLREDEASERKFNGVRRRSSTKIMDKPLIVNVSDEALSPGETGELVTHGEVDKK